MNKQKILEQLVSKVKLPISNNGTQLLEMLQKPIDVIDVDIFVKQIELDPALLSSVLHLANSPFYRGTENIFKLKDAITRIGLETIINSACLYFFQKTMPKIPRIEGFAIKNYWVHSWACATVNKQLGTLKACQQMGVLPSDLYIIGLLQGIGKISMAITYPKEFERCIMISTRNHIPLYQLEKKMFGASSANISAKIMGKWFFPDIFCEPIFYMNDPENAPLQYQNYACLTQLANYIVYLSEIGNNGDHGSLKAKDIYLCSDKGWVQAFKKEDVREALTKKMSKMLNKKKEALF